jgi:hypothetical protein
LSSLGAEATKRCNLNAAVQVTEPDALPTSVMTGKEKWTEISYLSGTAPSAALPDRERRQALMLANGK